MISVRLLITALFLACTVLGANAQSPSKPVARTILDYRIQLKLSPDQMAQMKIALNDYHTANQSRQAELKAAEDEFVARVSNHEPPESLRALFARIFKLREDCAWSDFETDHQLEALLTQPQILGWQKIQNTPATRVRVRGKYATTKTKASDLWRFQTVNESNTMEASPLK